MAAKRTLENGLSVLRAIARSDAFKEMRERFREGAERIADNDRLPRILAGSAGIVAALLTEPDPSNGQDDRSFGDEDALESELGHRDDGEGDGEVEFAAVRDLEEDDALEEPPEEEEELDTEPADNDARLLKFEGDEEGAAREEEREVEASATAQVPPAPAAGARSVKTPASNDAKAPVRDKRTKEAKAAGASNPEKGRGKPQTAPAPRKRKPRPSTGKPGGASNAPLPKPDAPRPKVPRATKTPRPPRGGGRAK